MPITTTIGGAFGYGRQQPQVTGIVTSGLRVNLDAGNSASYSGSGSTWSDLSGNGNNATLINTPTYSSSQSGYFSFLDTSTQYATISDIGSLSQWTVEAWFRPTASFTGKVTAIVTNQFDLSTKLNYSLGTNTAPGSYNICAGYFNGAWRTTSGFAPTLNTWVHVVGTYDGTTIRQYVNAVLNTSLTYTGTPQSGGQIRIARRWDETTASSNLYKGDISIIRIYNTALNAAEVLQNYNAVSSRYA